MTKRLTVFTVRPSEPPPEGHSIRHGLAYDIREDCTFDVVRQVWGTVGDGNLYVACKVAPSADDIFGEMFEVSTADLSAEDTPPEELDVVQNDRLPLLTSMEEARLDGLAGRRAIRLGSRAHRYLVHQGERLELPFFSKGLTNGKIFVMVKPEEQQVNCCLGHSFTSHSSTRWETGWHHTDAIYAKIEGILKRLRQQIDETSTNPLLRLEMPIAVLFGSDMAKHLNRSPYSYNVVGDLLKANENDLRKAFGPKGQTRTEFIATVRRYRKEARETAPREPSLRQEPAACVSLLNNWARLL